MKKFFRHITKVIIFSFVICLFLPFQAHSAMIDSSLVLRTPIHDKSGADGKSYSDFYALDYGDNLDLCVLAYRYPSSINPAVDNITYCLVASDTTVPIDYGKQVFFKSSNSDDFAPYGSLSRHSPNFWVDNERGQRCYYNVFYNVTSANYSDPTLPKPPFNFAIPVKEFTGQTIQVARTKMEEFVALGNISDYIPADTNTDNYSLDKSLGLVKNARWKHLESKDKYNQVLHDAMNSGTGTGDPGNAFYSDIYTRYAEFVQDKCSFATTSTTGIKIGGRYKLQYSSRVGFTFAYNLPDLLEHTDFTKQYYKRFGSPKPYPIVNGTNFDANQNIQSLFLQAYQWNDSLPSVGNLKRSLIFKETKYWIDVRIIDTKTKTYGAWYAMDMKNNTAKEVVTDNGDIDSDVSSEDDAGNYTKEEGEGDTFQDAEDNAKEVDHSTRYDQTWYDSIKDNTKHSAPAFKNLLSMITGIPKMIATLFSWLPSWVLELVSAFFAIIIVLALLRFVLGS